MAERFEDAAEVERRAIAVAGIVQGVGFRPFVYALALRHGLRGCVRNEAGSVAIEVEGAPRAIEEFLAALTAEAPPLARIESVRSEPRARRGDAVFRIAPSRERTGGPRLVSPDVATCADCVRELFDRGDRRYRYPFINCTNCGPRLTIIRTTPYDRERTTMASFVLCAACRAEYEDPLDRRFHAQPVACADCGPRLRALDARGQPVAGEPLDAALAAIRSGAIVAVKGLGGYHLACDARSEDAVVALRQRKRREEKPFAVMVHDLAAARALAELGAHEGALLESPERPIVLVPRRRGASVAASVAPETPLLGLMLPYTPLHHLLLRDIEAPLVMTSGNRSDEPIAYEDGDALERLSGIADLFLLHDRPIETRCDDSIVRPVAGSLVPFRRSRGYAPCPIALPCPLERPTLAAGGHLKSSFALGQGARAVLSHHLGDLEDYGALRAYRRSIARYRELFGIEPVRIVTDLHPDYASTREALALALEEPPLRVQHHHAHMASCLAENGFDGRAIGVIWDGSGLGLDGAIWGGEFLVGDGGAVRRAAHLAYAPLPGGERAIREPWRMALAHLWRAGIDPLDSPLARRIDRGTLGAVQSLCERGLYSPPTSSVGRLFDAVASLAGVCDLASFEGQPAIRLEALAADEAPAGSYSFTLVGSRPIAVDPGPIIRGVHRDVSAGVTASTVARRFHATLVELIVAVCEALRLEEGLGAVALSGGVFMNAILATEATARLEHAGFRVLRHGLVPPNDGGLSLGQLAIAAALDAAARKG